MDEIKKALAAGMSFGAAVKDKLGMSIEQFTAKHSLYRPDFSEVINGRRVPDDKQLAALVKHLGGSNEEWLDLWFKSARKQRAAV